MNEHENRLLEEVSQTGRAHGLPWRYGSQAPCGSTQERAPCSRTMGFVDLPAGPAPPQVTDRGPSQCRLASPSAGHGSYAEPSKNPPFETKEIGS